MMKKLISIAIAIVIVVAVFAALGGTKIFQFKKMMAAGESYTPPPETVSTTTVKEETWQETLMAIGTITAVQGVTVTPEIPGSVKEIKFESGAIVAKDDLLVRLDTSSEEAQLQAVDAQLELNQITLNRARTLRKENTVSQSELDIAEAGMKQTKANADVIRATIAKKTIRAPFAGQLGLRLVNLGQYLEAGKPVVSLQCLSPVYLEFSLPQQEISRLQTGMKVRAAVDAFPDQTFEGVLTAINPDLDQNTRSVNLQATFQNNDKLLRPGMFAKVDVLLPMQRKVLTIPLTSVLSAPYGNSVFVITPTNSSNAKPILTVRQQIVRTGKTRGNFVTVESGLKEGEKIVQAGLFKLRNGMTVVENNTIVPSANDGRQPTDS